MKQFGFDKKKRLVSKRQFDEVFARGLRVCNGLLMLYMAPNDCGYPRLGVSVGKSRGNAVVRNRLKRLLREAFRRSQDRIPGGYDYLLMLSPRWSKKPDQLRPGRAAKGLPFDRFEASLLALAAEGLAKATAGG